LKALLVDHPGFTQVTGVFADGDVPPSDGGRSEASTLNDGSGDSNTGNDSGDTATGTDADPG
jgi:hypothetical protein